MCPLIGWIPCVVVFGDAAFGFRIIRGAARIARYGVTAMTSTGTLRWARGDSVHFAADQPCLSANR